MWGIREQGNMLREQLQQFMIMFSDQHQVRISPDFPPKEHTEPILPGIGSSNRNVGLSEVEMDLSTEEEN